MSESDTSMLLAVALSDGSVGCTQCYIHPGITTIV